MSKKKLCILWFIIVICFTTFQQIKYRYTKVDNISTVKYEQNNDVLTLKDGNNLILKNNYLKLNSKKNINITFDTFTLIFGLILGIISCLLSFILAYFLYKNYIKKIKYKYPNDEILYSYTPLRNILTFCQFFIGGFIGSYLLPFYLFKNVTQIKMVNSDTLFIYTILSAVVFVGFIFLSAYTLLLTDKRLMFIGSCKILTKDVEWLLSDINEVQISKSWVALLKKDNDKIFPNGWRVNNECYAILKKYIKKED